MLSAAVWWLASAQQCCCRVAGWWFLAHQHVRRARQRVAAERDRRARGPEPIAAIHGQNLRELRETAGRLHINVGRHRRWGERLTRTDDFRAALLRALAAG